MLRKIKKSLKIDERDWYLIEIYYEDARELDISVEYSYGVFMLNSQVLLDPNSEQFTIERLGGEQIVSPRPAVPHAKVASRLLMLLNGYELKMGGPGGWYFLFEPELHVGPDPDIMIPDLAGWRVEHVTAEMETAVSVKIAPDWVCEVLSPSTARVDYTKKLPLYAREGVKHVWLIDPILPLLEVLRLEKGHYSILGSYSEVFPHELEPFGPLRLDLLW